MIGVYLREEHMGAKIEFLLGLSCLSPLSRPVLPAGHPPSLTSTSLSSAAVCTRSILPWGPSGVLGAPIECCMQITGGAQLVSRPSSMMASVCPCPGLVAPPQLGFLPSSPLMCSVCL